MDRIVIGDQRSISFGGLKYCFILFAIFQIHFQATRDLINCPLAINTIIMRQESERRLREQQPSQLSKSQKAKGCFFPEEKRKVENLQHQVDQLLRQRQSFRQQMKIEYGYHLYLLHHSHQQHKSSQDQQLLALQPRMLRIQQQIEAKDFKPKEIEVKGDNKGEDVLQKGRNQVERCQLSSIGKNHQSREEKTPSSELLSLKRQLSQSSQLSALRKYMEQREAELKRLREEVQLANYQIECLKVELEKQQAKNRGLQLHKRILAKELSKYRLPQTNSSRNFIDRLIEEPI